MAGFLDISGGNIIADEGGRRSLDTRAPMLNRVPSAEVYLSSYAIEFPDLWKGTLYHQYRQGPDVFGTTDFGCSTWVGLVEQEWGPGEASPNTLADAAIASVPAGTDYLEIWVRLTRTVTPANMLDLALAGCFPEGEWVKLDGYSCVIEEFMGVARQFEFVLSGTTVLLRRYQSVTNSGGVVSPTIPRETGSAVLGNKVFYFPGTNAPTDSSKLAVYGKMIDQKGPSRNAPTHRPSGYEAGSSNNSPCSTSLAGISYASTWTGDIKITPCCFSA